MGVSAEDSSRNMADVRPVRQPWSRCVAHQSSSSEDEEEFAGEEGEELGEVGK